VIDVEGLTFTYPGADEATLHGLDFHIEDQEIFGFLGPSGAGKSTTQKLLIGLLHGYGGRMEVMGREVEAWGPDYYETIGVSFELPNHYTRLTALENLEHFGALYRGELLDPMELLESVGLHQDAHKRVADFSKGMKIRLNVARALLHRPRLLFLDEPTSGLDPVSARRMKELIGKKRDEGATVFVTTHDMTVAEQICDRVAFITDGRLRSIGSPGELEKRYGRRVVRVEYRAGDGLEAAEFSLDGLGDDRAFADLIASETIETIHSQETTLENVFIEVTGQELSAGKELSA